MNNKIKLGLTALMLVGSAIAIAAEDLKSTGLAPEPVTTTDITSTTSTTSIGSDMGVGGAVNSASMAVTKAQEATEAARIANEAAKVANDVAKMATDKALEATETAKKAMDASSGMGMTTGSEMDTTDNGVKKDNLNGSKKP